ncbi:MAG TPA: hypothetical protein VIG36_06805 [Methylocystis sp.]|jgi:hypothetical protein
MDGKRQEPDYRKLSAAEKDRLIAALLKERDELLIRLAGNSPSSEQSTGRHALLKRLRERGASKKDRSPDADITTIKLGRLRFLRSRTLKIAGIGLAALLLVDQSVGKYRALRIEQQRQADLILENKAFSGIYSELVRVELEPDRKSFRLTTAIQSVDPSTPLYVMIEPTRVFEQAGFAWKEVPAKAMERDSTGVVKLTGRHEFQTIFTPNVEDRAELMPGYMHIRFESELLVSLRAEPEEDIKARKDRYYVYLKRTDASDQEIKEKMNYKSDPPLFIPMPPH